MTHELRHDDPVYYKKALRGLICEAMENNIKVTASKGKITGKGYIFFESDNGEKTAVEFDWEEQKLYRNQKNTSV